MQDIHHSREEVEGVVRRDFASRRGGRRRGVDRAAWREACRLLGLVDKEVA